MHSIKIRPEYFSEMFSERIDCMLHQSAGLLSKLDPPLLLGRFRELLVRNLLEYLVPQTCSITYGTVVDSWGQRPHSKKEDDILIVDRECLPPFFEFGTEGVYPIESVLARIEVKSTLDACTLKQAIDGAIGFSRLTPALREYPRDSETETAQAPSAPIRKHTLKTASDRGLRNYDRDAGSPPDFEMETAQVLFGFKSDYAEPETVFPKLRQFMDERSRSEGIHSELPFIRHLCVPRVGYWVYTNFKGQPCWYHCDADTRDYSEVLSFIALLLHELPAIRDARRKATLADYIGCLREGRLRRID